MRCNSHSRKYTTARATVPAKSLHIYLSVIYVIAVYISRFILAVKDISSIKTKIEIVVYSIFVDLLLFLFTFLQISFQKQVTEIRKTEVNQLLT